MAESECAFVPLSPLEMFDLETNEHVQRAVEDRQMPKVEYRKIDVDDYSECAPLWRKASETPGDSPKSSQGA